MKVYESETRPLIDDAVLNFEKDEMQIGWMCWDSMKDRRTSEELRKMMSV